MNNFFKVIISKLKKEIEIEEIEIVDNSYKHIKHKSFSSDKFHLHLKIKSLYLIYQYIIQLLIIPFINYIYLSYTPEPHSGTD